MAGYSVTYTVVDNATKTINDINKKIQQLRAPMEQQAKAMGKFLDVSGLQKVSDGFGAVARTSADAFSSLARMVPVMGAITGAATLAGLASLIKGFTDLGTQLERNADYLGTSTSTLNQWQNAVKLAGGSVENLNEGMKELAKTGYDAALGRNAVAMQRFTRAGITANDLMHKSATELMPQVLDYINRFTDARDRETVATQLGGRALYELNEDFRLSGKSYVEWMEAAKKYGAVLDPDRLRRYRQAVGELDVAFSGLGTEITEVMATALSPFIKDFATWVHENQPEIIAAVKQIAQAFSDLASVLKTIMGYATDVANRLAGVPTAQDILDDSPLAKGLTDEQKRAILAAHPEVHATPQWGPAQWARENIPGVATTQGESPEEREARIRKQLGVPYAPAAPAAPAPTVPPTGTVPPQSSAAPGTPAASLAAERQRFAQELKDNPALREKLINIAATEQSNPQGNQAVIETMMNRAAAQGTSLAAQVRRTSEGGYYAGSDNPAAVAANRSMIEGNLDKVLGGSNISNFATDNASNQPGNRLADKRINNNEMQLRYQAGGEYFFSPSNPAISGAGTVNKYKAWLSQHPTAPTPDSVGPSPTGTPGGGSAGSVVDQMVSLAGTRGAAVREFLRDPSGKIARDPDLGLWCAEFTNAALQHMGVKGTGSLMAASFAQWGQQVAADQVTKGDVLLNFNRKHVGLATGRTRTGAGGQLEVEEVSSNSLGPGGELLNLPGTRWRSDVEVRRSGELAAAQAKGAPMSVAGAGKPANGSVDVTVTHKNAPPGTSVSGTAEGAGVNLIGPRIEQQQLSAA